MVEIFRASCDCVIGPAGCGVTVTAGAGVGWFVLEFGEVLGFEANVVEAMFFDEFLFDPGLLGPLCCAEDGQ